MFGHATWGRGKKRRHRYYRCFNYVQKGKSACAGRAVRADDVENVVVESLFDLRVNSDKLRTLLTTEWDERRKAVPPLKRTVARLEQELAKIAHRDEKIMLAFETGAYSPQDMAARRAKAAADRVQVEAALADAQAQLAHVTADTTNVKLIAQCLEHAYDLYAHNGFEERRGLVHALIQEVVVEDRSRGHFTLRDLEQMGGWLEGAVGNRVFVLDRTGARADI